MSEFYCQIDRTKLAKVRMYDLPAADPTRPPLLYTFSEDTVTMRPLNGGSFYEITDKGIEYLQLPLFEALIDSQLEPVR